MDGVPIIGHRVGASISQTSCDFVHFMVGHSPNQANAPVGMIALNRCPFILDDDVLISDFDGDTVHDLDAKAVFFLPIAFR